MMYAGRICDLDAEGRSLIWRACDLKARWMLIDAAEETYNRGCKAQACTLIHAYTYLADRLAYELHPWPKNKLPASYFGGRDKLLEIGG